MRATCVVLCGADEVLNMTLAWQPGDQSFRQHTLGVLGIKLLTNGPISVDVAIGVLGRRTVVFLMAPNPFPLQVYCS